MPAVNNDFYSSLGERWFEGDDHAIALLRVESRIKLGYVREVLDRTGFRDRARILDVACGAGLVARPLAEAGYDVLGVDLSAGAVDTAKGRMPELASLRYEVGDAYDLEGVPGVASEGFDVVLLLDMLEHVDRPADVLREAARVLRPGGVVLFHTFNQTPLAWLLAIHGFRFVVRDVPEHVHVWDLFIAPSALQAMASEAGLDVQEIRGVRPRFDRALVRSVLRRRVDPDFQFTYTSSVAVGYAGFAVKEG